MIRSAVHAATRCALAITTLLPGFNLENIAFEQEKKRGALHDGVDLDQLRERVCGMTAVQCGDLRPHTGNIRADTVESGSRCDVKGLAVRITPCQIRGNLWQLDCA